MAAAPEQKQAAASRAEWRPPAPPEPQGPNTGNESKTSDKGALDA